MNVYDFDKTIFYPDSTYCFFGLCLRKHPFLIAKRLPRITAVYIRKLCGKAETKDLKETLFSFLEDCPDTDKLLSEFWDTHFGNVRKWYLDQKKDDDLIISASPEFIIGPCCEKLGIQYMGTRMDKKTGKISGRNCHDSEKVIRFREVYPDGVVDEFYSDSYSDSPMAGLASKAVLVKKDELCKW